MASHHLSRRAFLSSAAALGALTFLGAEPALDGNLSLAFASEDGQRYFVVYVLSPEEVPLLAIDLQGGKKVPVAGMSITLTSLYNQKTVTVVTDSAGCAVANIRALTEEAEDDWATSFSGWVSVRASKAGYRSYLQPEAMARSAVPVSDDGSFPNVIQVPTQPLADNPYFSVLSLDGVDVQYCPREIALLAENDMVHSLGLRLEDCKTVSSDGTTWEFALECDGTVLATASSTQQDGAVVTALRGQWLDGEHGIVPGSKLILRFKALGDSFSASFNPPMTFVQGRMAIENGYSESLALSVGDSDPQQKEKAGPSSDDHAFSWFVNKNDSFTFGLPFVPINVFADKTGNFGLSMTLFTCDIYKSKNGQKQEIDKASRWKSVDDLSGSGWWSSYKKQLNGKMDQFSDLLDNALNEDGTKNFLGHSKWTSSFNVAVNIDAQLAASWVEVTDKDDKKIDHYHGDFVVLGKFALNYNRTILFCIGWFPCYFTFDFAFSAQAKFLTGLQFDRGFKNIRYGHKTIHETPFPMSFVISLSAELGLGVGFGVSGILSIGVRGFASLTMVLSLDGNDDAGKEGAHWPHITLTGKANIEAVGTALTFKKTVQITKVNPWTIADNWNSSSVLQGSNALPDNRFGMASPLSSGGTADFEMIEEKDLKAAVEFSSRVDERGITSSFGFAGATLLRDVSGQAGIHDPYAGAPEVASSGRGTLLGAALTFGNQGYNPLHGVRPTIQQKLWADAFSAPRARVIKVPQTTQSGGGIYLLRVVMTEVEIPSSNRNLQVVRSGNGCLFAQPTLGHTLPVVSFKDDGGLAYPGFDDMPCATMEFLDTGEDQGQQGLLSATDLVSLFTDDSKELGTPVNDTKIIRARLSAARLFGNEWGTPEVIDFAIPATTPDLMRANMWDTDFDVVVGPSGSVYIALGGMVRLTESTSFDDQFEQQFMTMMRCEAKGLGLAAKEVKICSAPMGQDGVCWHPRVAVHQDEHGNDHPSIHYYMRRNRTDCLRHQSWSVDMRAGEWRRTSSTSNNILPSSFMRQHLAEGSLQVRSAVAGGASGEGALAYAWTCPALAEEGEVTAVSREAYAVVWGADEYFGEPLNDGVKELPGVDHVACGAVASGDQGLATDWLYSVASLNGGERLLRRVRMTCGETNANIEEMWPLGHLRVGQQFFCSENGTRLFAARAMEGNTDPLPEEALGLLEKGAQLYGSVGKFNSPAASFDTPESATGQGATVQQYQLLCSDYDAEHDAYCDFYPLADLDFAPDTLLEIPSGLSLVRKDFIIGTITDAGQNLLDVYQVSVPELRGLQLESGCALSEFVAPGQQCAFQVSVSNTGNVPISGFFVHVVEAETQKKVCDHFLQDLADALLDSEDMMRPVYDENGMPTDAYEMEPDAADGRGLLWPGKTRSYRFKATLPADFEAGTHKLRMTVSNPIGESGASLQSEDDQAVLCVDPRARLSSVSVSEDGMVTSSLNEAGYSIDGKHDGNSSGSGSMGGSGKSASTGDSLPLAALLGISAASIAGIAIGKDLNNGDSPSPMLGATPQQLDV